MSDGDVKHYGGDTPGCYWVAVGGGTPFGEPHCQLVRFNDLGECINLGLKREFDPEALTREQARLDYFAKEAAAADAELEKRKREESE